MTLCNWVAKPKTESALNLEKYFLDPNTAQSCLCCGLLVCIAITVFTST